MLINGNEIEIITFYIQVNVPFQPLFLHHSTENVALFYHLLFLFQQFFYFLGHLELYQCRHLGRIQKNSEILK